MPTIEATVDPVLEMSASTTDIDGETYMNLPIGTYVYLRATITMNGSPYDPTDVVLQLKRPEDPVKVYKNSFAQLTKDSIGHYSRAVLLDRSGPWRYRFTSVDGYVRSTTGDVVITVDPSEFTSL